MLTKKLVGRKRPVEGPSCMTRSMNSWFLVMTLGTRVFQVLDYPFPEVRKSIDVTQHSRLGLQTSVILVAPFTRSQWTGTLSKVLYLDLTQNYVH